MVYRSGHNLLSDKDSHSFHLNEKKFCRLIRSLVCGDDIVENAHHPFSCELNQRHLELIPGLLSRLTSLDLMVRPLDEFEHDEVPKEIKILGDHCLNIRQLRGDFLPLIDLKLSRFFLSQ